MYTYNDWGVNRFSGLDNMALEEYFLRVAAKSRSAHVRFYDFDRDTVVLGYNQATDVVKRWDSSFTLTRRASGGSHVHIGRNVLAYSVIVPRDGSFRNHQDFRVFYGGKVAAALERAGMKDITSDHDASTIMQDGRVIASHAVTWGVRSALLHGIVHITPYNMTKLLDRITVNARRIGGKEYHEATALRNIPTATDVLKLKPHASIVQRASFVKNFLADQMRSELGTTSKRLLSESILLRARRLQREKYAQELWIKQRDPTFTPDEIEEFPGESLDGPLHEKQGYCLYSQVKNKDFKRMADP